MTRDERAQLIATQKRVETLTYELRAISNMIDRMAPSDPDAILRAIDDRINQTLRTAGDDHAP